MIIIGKILQLPNLQQLTIESLTVDDLVTCHAGSFDPSAALLVIVGDIDPEAMGAKVIYQSSEKLFVQTLSSWQQSQSPDWSDPEGPDKRRKCGQKLGIECMERVFQDGEGEHEPRHHSGRIDRNEAGFHSQWRLSLCLAS